MPVVDGGFIILARKMFEGNLMDKPDLWVKLWLWMIFKANFKDHGKLKRGQLLTSIKEMQDAVSYKVGYRKKRPTVGQIRSAYEAFTNNNMVSVAKTTRGMIVTVLNYDKYQTLDNYEQHTEQHSGEQTNNTVTTHDKGSQGKSSKKNPPFIPPKVEEVAAYCSERGNTVDPKQFIAFYESKGWMIGKNKMKSWKSAVITWEGRDKKQAAKQKIVRHMVN